MNNPEVVPEQLRITSVVFEMDLNSEDIESVTILKGPEATALYGSDGASGAIVITTKKGRQGKASIRYGNYKIRYGIG